LSLKEQQFPNNPNQEPDYKILIYKFVAAAITDLKSVQNSMSLLFPSKIKTTIYVDDYDDNNDKVYTSYNSLKKDCALEVIDKVRIALYILYRFLSNDSTNQQDASKAINFVLNSVLFSLDDDTLKIVISRIQFVDKKSEVYANSLVAVQAILYALQTSLSLDFNDLASFKLTLDRDMLKRWLNLRDQTNPYVAQEAEKKKDFDDQPEQLMEYSNLLNFTEKLIKRGTLEVKKIKDATITKKSADSTKNYCQDYAVAVVYSIDGYDFTVQAVLDGVGSQQAKSDKNELSYIVGKAIEDGLLGAYLFYKLGDRMSNLDNIKLAEIKALITEFIEIILLNVAPTTLALTFSYQQHGNKKAIVYNIGDSSAFRMYRDNEKQQRFTALSGPDHLAGHSFLKVLRNNDIYKNSPSVVQKIALNVAYTFLHFMGAYREEWFDICNQNNFSDSQMLAQYKILINTIIEYVSGDIDERQKRAVLDIVYETVRDVDYDKSLYGETAAGDYYDYRPGLFDASTLQYDNNWQTISGAISKDVIMGGLNLYDLATFRRFELPDDATILVMTDGVAENLGNKASKNDTLVDMFEKFLKGMKKMVTGNSLPGQHRKIDDQGLSKVPLKSPTFKKSLIPYGGVVGKYKPVQEIPGQAGFKTTIHLEGLTPTQIKILETYISDFAALNIGEDYQTTISALRRLRALIEGSEGFSPAQLEIKVVRDDKLNVIGCIILKEKGKEQDLD